MADVGRSRDAALGRCRKHPWHHQSPGVCSLCLVERLSRLSSSSSSSKKPSYRMARSVSSSSPSSVSTYYSSSSESSYCPSPSRRPRHGGRLADEARSGPLMLSALFFGGRRDAGGLKKSRSMAAEAVPKVEKVGEDEKKKKKKKEGKESRGFWSKLLVNRRMKKRREADDNNKGLKRSGSTTVREEVTT